jgi:hypothetical protein
MALLWAFDTVQADDRTAQCHLQKRHLNLTYFSYVKTYTQNKLWKSFQFSEESWVLEMATVYSACVLH